MQVKTSKTSTRDPQNGQETTITAQDGGWPFFLPVMLGMRSGSCGLVAANNGVTCQATSCAGTQYIAGNYCNNGICVSVPIECNYNTLTGTTWSGTKCSCNTATVCQSAASGYEWSGSDCRRQRAYCLNACNGNNYLSCITLSEGACCSGCQPPTYSYDYACPSLFGTAGAYSQY
jgi:hypothetical protein